MYVRIRIVANHLHNPVICGLIQGNVNSNRQSNQAKTSILFYRFYLLKYFYINLYGRFMEFYEKLNKKYSIQKQ